MRVSGLVGVSAAAAALILTTVSGASAGNNASKAWNPGPPPCLTSIYVHPNTSTVETEIQLPLLDDLRFGDHLYRRYVRGTSSKVRGKFISFPLNWMDACEGMGAPQQVLMLGKYSSLGFINGDYAQFRDTTVARKRGGSWAEVRGEINVEYQKSGGPYRWGLGLPLTSETPTPSRIGAFNHFERGSIYWSPVTGARVIRGAIRDKWASLGWENSFLGFPTTSETRTPRGSGKFNQFEGGAIYWSPRTGAHEVRGVIRDKWASLGWENSRLGFPTSDEFAIDGGRRSNFQNNCYIAWYPWAGSAAYCSRGGGGGGSF